MSGHKRVSVRLGMLLLAICFFALETAALTERQVKASVPFQIAKGVDQEQVFNLIPYANRLIDLDKERRSIHATNKLEELDMVELKLVEKALKQHGMHLNWFTEQAKQKQKRSLLLNSFPQSLKVLADLYYRAGHLKLTTGAVYDLAKESKSDDGTSMPPSHMNDQEEAIIQVYTAAQLNHKRARFLLAIILENGILPAREVLSMATAKEARYNFLNFVVDVEKSVLFKYQEDPAAARTAFAILSEFEADTKAQSISNLYLSSQITQHKMLFEYLKSDEFIDSKDSTFTDFTVNESKRKHMLYLEEQNRISSVQAAPAQMSLGSRFQYGISVGEDCDTSTHYYEAAARHTIDYIELTHGLIGPQKLKLSLMGPQAIQEVTNFGNAISMDHIYTSSDVVDLLDQQGQYGSTESLNFLGFTNLIGKGKIPKNFVRAHELFQKALDIDKKDQTANYCLGLMHMLGLVPGQEDEPNLDLAVKHYLRANDDVRAMNALGVIYYIAPDPFETNPERLAGFKAIRRNRKKAKLLLERAVEGNNVQASFNLGAIHLDETVTETFSFSKAYDYFKTAASMGHTLAAYNIGVMHYTGLGTFKSCNVANAFLQHVVTMGEDSIDMHRAYRLVEKGRYFEATMLYMELAEMGQGVAALNTALLLEKYPIFDTDRTLIGQLASRAFNEPKQLREERARLGTLQVDGFDLNKQLAFRYFQTALYQKETEEEASLKLADFMYYGTAGMQDLKQALSIYKVTENRTQNIDVRGHALLKLGMIYQFGEGDVAVDHDIAQVYYEKALKDYSSVQVPVYLLSLHSKWQRLDVLATLTDFVVEFVEEPWSRGSALIATIIVYLLCLCGTVKLLRNQALKEDQ